MRLGAPDPARYPKTLRDAKRWLTWTVGPGGSRKPPCDADAKPLKGWTDPAEWLTWDQAADRLADNSAISGLGFMLGDDGDGAFVGLDIDHARMPDGTVHPELVPIDALLEFYRDRGVYCEVSPSGTGWKLIGRSAAPEWLELSCHEDGTVDVGGDRSPRFFAITGTEASGDPSNELDLSMARARFSKADAPEAEAEGTYVPANPLPEAVRPGRQNALLFAEACRHVRQGKTKAEVFAITKAVQQERCPSAPGADPWTDGDIGAIVASAMRYKADVDTFPCTESGDAEFFSKTHLGQVLYNHRTGTWLRYDDVRWKHQGAGEVDYLALMTIRARQAAALLIEDPDIRKGRSKWSMAGESRTRRNNLLSLATVEPGITDDGEDWDSDAFLLGVPNGVVDLRTGTLRAARPGDRISKQAAYPFNPEAKCPLWEDTLTDIFQDNPALVPYLWRVLGYALTGDTREEVFFLLIGEGRNGKGTIINTIETLLGDYSTSLSFASLEATKHGRTGGAASPDIAKLAGARFVTASETSGGSFNASLLKGLTGRDTISARFLHKGEFEFLPALKLFLSVNEHPKVDDQSLGFWSRPHMIPFGQAYTGERCDNGLKDKLLQEGEGILAWLVKGCLAWQKEGLEKPAAVVSAVDDYRHSQGVLVDFIQARCITSKDEEVHGRDLFNEYKSWCMEERLHRDEKLGLVKFHRAVKNLDNVDAQKTNTGLIYFGLGIAHGQKQEEF